MPIGEVRRVIFEHRRPGHPDNVTDSAREEICLQSVASWRGPLDKLASETFSMLRKAVVKVLNDSLGIYKQTDLYRQSKHYIRQFLQAHQDSQARILEGFYALGRLTFTYSLPVPVLTEPQKLTNCSRSTTRPFSATNPKS